MRNQKQKTLKEKYGNLKVKRERFLSRAENYARATLPYIMEEGDKAGDEANGHGWQGFGAKVVNHLSNRIIMTLFPPSRSFFKLDFSSTVRRDLDEQGWDSTSLATELAAIEDDAMKYMDQTTPRDLDIKTAKHLIITGNYLHYFPDTKKEAVGIGLDQYVVRRDTHGTLIEVIIKQTKMMNSLPQDVQDKIRSNSKNAHVKGDTEVELYTGACLQKDGKYLLYQEALDEKIGSEYRMKYENLPFTVLMWNHTHGEDYGRGLVEDHAGDFHVIEVLSEAVAKGMVLMSDIKYIVKPGSYTNIEHLASSPMGEFISGNIDDIGVLQLERYADFSPILEVLNDYQRRVGEAFMVSRAARRDAERVTAYEIRQDAADLEVSLGGVYSRLSQSWQKPRAKRLLRMSLKEAQKGTDASNRLKVEDFEPQIITGTEALGRMNELDKIMQFSEMLQMPNNWPETMQQRVKWDKFGDKIAAEIGIEIDWLMDDDEFQKLQQSQQRQMMQQRVAEEASKAAPDLVKQQAGE